MNNKLKVFDNNEFGAIRVIELNGDIYFVGKDIVEKLGYNLETGKYTKYINRYVDEEDFVEYTKETCVQFGNEFNYKELGQRGGLLINESGLYSLILNSKLPSAKQFKRWVTSEVLPSIRKNGGYIATTEQDDESTIMAKALMIAQATIEKNKKRINELSSENQKLIIENNHKQDIIETFSDDISLAEKRQRIAQIVNYKPAEDSSEYKDRWNLLYSEFEKKYHMNLNLRVKRTISKHKLKRLSKMDYIDGYLDMIPELYDLTIVLFETSYDYIIDKFNM